MAAVPAGQRPPRPAVAVPGGHRIRCRAPSAPRAPHPSSTSPNPHAHGPYRDQDLRHRPTAEPFPDTLPGQGPSPPEGDRRGQPDVGRVSPPTATTMAMAAVAAMAA